MRALLPTIDPTVWMQVSGTIFLTLFTLLVIWVYLPSRAAFYEQQGEIPLVERDDD